jgi:hypothetical protein
MVPVIDYDLPNYGKMMYVSKCQKYIISSVTGTSYKLCDELTRIGYNPNYKDWLEYVDKYIKRTNKINRLLDETGN